MTTWAQRVTWRPLAREGIALCSATHEYNGLLYECGRGRYHQGPHAFDLRVEWRDKPEDRQEPTRSDA